MSALASNCSCQAESSWRRHLSSTDEANSVAQLRIVRLLPVLTAGLRLLLTGFLLLSLGFLEDLLESATPSVIHRCASCATAQHIQNS